MMRTRTVVAISTVLLAAAGVWFFAGRSDREESYRLVEITRGDIVSTVSATGGLGAVSTVQVGTQVSGQIAEIFVDFNDRVKKGQVVARIDPTLAQQAVREAQASLDRARADTDMKQFAFDQAAALYQQRVITETEFRTAEFNRAASMASLQSAEASLERAQRNLEYTVIYAPIDGIVVERNVDVGQTVAASLSAPQLFLIARDLSRMQILASVDESDIGQIHERMAAHFTVQAYPERVFTGSVQQVRLQSRTTENVVNYTVVIAVPNTEGWLLPGMTATVDIEMARVTNVLRVPNAALRFRASEAMQAAVREHAVPDTAVRSVTSDPALRRGVAPGQRATRTGADTASGSSAQLWYLDAEGRLAVVRVRTGLTDGQNTEIAGPIVCEGMKVIAGVVQSGAPSTGLNPFQQTQRQGGPPRPPGTF
jgi:HlyD family secretion protein